MDIPPGLAADFRRARQLEVLVQQNPRAIALLIQVYQQMLERLQPEESPDFYSTIQTNLANAYARLPTGDHAANLSRAIACLQEALRFQTVERTPEEYATTQSNLGLTYSDLPGDDRAANLASAISCYRQALRVWTPETAPLDYALTQINLGLAYRSLPTDERATNLTQAIKCFQEALRFLTPQDTLADYIATQAYLGDAYNELPTGDPAINLIRAIACYQEALRYLPPEMAPQDYAHMQTNLGNAYGRLLTGDRTANLTQAITCYQEALRFLTPEMAPQDYAMLQHNLGAVYSSLPMGDRQLNLTRAIRCFQEALRFRRPETAPLDYAKTQSDLGLAYSDLPAGDRTANLKQAIACFQQALRFLTPETAPLEYGLARHNLGGAYQQLPTGDRATNLEEAITCYQEALRFLTPEVAPLDYAMVQNNLGVAYSNLPTGDRTGNLKQTIACYEEALRFRRPETAPFDYATTMHNLGNAYTKLPTGNHKANLKRALACYEEALRFWTPETAPSAYAMAQTNLGNAYSEFPTDDHAADLTQAITCYEEALRFLTLETAPFDYARAQNSLGNAYRDLPTGDRAANLAQAAACFHKTLAVWTAETAPWHYAMARFNLGLTYKELPTGDRATNLKEAIRCFQEVLRIWTLETAPAEYRKVNSNVADLYFAQGEWKAALSAARAAMNAGEQLYRAGLSSESKAIELAENAALYRHAAFAAARCGEPTEALLILERGKTRMLTEALRLRIPRPASVPDDVWMAFERARAAVRRVQSEGGAMPGEGRDPVQTYRSYQQAARTAHTALEAATERVRVHAKDKDKNFLREIDLPTTRALLLDERTVLVAFCITEQGSIGVVVGHDPDQEVQVVEVPNFTHTELHRLLLTQDADGEAVGGWLIAYVRHLEEPGNPATLAAWQTAITNSLATLGQCLLAPILSALPPGIERIIFLPSAELFLLPLHAAPLSRNERELVCDRYQVSYAPSIEVLTHIRERAVQGAAPDLYAVINPEADSLLAFSPMEGRAIAGLFTRQDLDEGPVGTKQRVMTRVRGRTYVHFSCHGTYDWNDPTLSGLDLADGCLTLADLQRGLADLSSARLVTLSACGTGITDILHGSAEEYVSVPAGFMLAGVPCVVSSLWAVSDLSTALLMERFYRNHLSGGMDFVAALREAQLWIRQATARELALADTWDRIYQASGESDADAFRWMRYYQARPGDRPFAHPYFWAAFSVNGM